jgi:hypothetical protein
VLPAHTARADSIAALALWPEVSPEGDVGLTQLTNDREKEQGPG